MNNTLRNTLLVLLGFAMAAGLFYDGVVFGSRSQAAGYGPYGMMNYGGGPGMMGGYAGPNGTGSYGYGPGMMSGGGMMGGGMMGGYGYGGLGSGKPLSVADARSAVEAYLTGLGNDDLAIKEIMIF